MHPRLQALRGNLSGFVLSDHRVELASRLLLWRDEIGDSGYRGRFLSGSSKEADLISLIEHYTAPALARALRDRETTLSQCSAAFSRADMLELEQLLLPFKTVKRIAQSTVPNLPAPDIGGIFAPEILSELSIRLSRLPREISKRSANRASVVIPLVHHNGEPAILFTKRAVSMRRHPGEVCFPGGMVDNALDRTIIEAGLREMSEEIGVSPDNVEVLGVMRLHWDDLMSITGVAVTPLIAYLGQFENLNIKINPEEVKSCFSIPMFDIVNRTKWEFPPGRTPVYRPGVNDDTVWGLTASLLDRFLTLLPSVLYK